MIINMTSIAKLKFHVLGISVNNYQSWNLNIELQLYNEALVEFLKKDEKTTDKDKEIETKIALVKRFRFSWWFWWQNILSNQWLNAQIKLDLYYLVIWLYDEEIANFSILKKLRMFVFLQCNNKYDPLR